MPVEPGERRTTRRERRSLSPPKPRQERAHASANARSANSSKPCVDELIAEYANSDRGMEIREIAGGYRMATKPEYHDAVRGFVKSLKPPMKLSLQALETLAVIAYKQPVTAPEVSEIRGVDSGGVLGSLVSRKLITTAGRKQVIGRPILYKTTQGVSASLWAEGCERTAQHGGVRKDGRTTSRSAKKRSSRETASLPFEDADAATDERSPSSTDVELSDSATEDSSSHPSLPAEDHVTHS